MNLTILVATSEVKNSPVFTDLSIQACKSFIALATGVHRNQPSISGIFATTIFGRKNSAKSTISHHRICPNKFWRNFADSAYFAEKSSFCVNELYSSKGGVFAENRTDFQQNKVVFADILSKNGAWFQRKQCLILAKGVLDFADNEQSLPKPPLFG